jgi:hypothetical protein
MFIFKMLSVIPRNSVVGIATLCGLDGPEIKPRYGRDFPHPSRPALGAHPAFYKMGTGSFPEAKWWSVALATHPHLAPMLKKEWRYTSTPRLCFHCSLWGELYL